MTEDRILIVLLVFLAIVLEVQILFLQDDLKNFMLVTREITKTLAESVTSNMSALKKLAGL